MKLPNIDFEDERCREAFARIFSEAESDEEWRFVVTPDFVTEHYIISDRGRLISLPRYRYYEANRRSQVVHKKFLPGGFRKTGAQPTGYQTITISHKKQVFTTHLHRLVAWAFLGPQPAGFQVRHLDGNPANNALQNLEYVSPWNNSWEETESPGMTITIDDDLKKRIDDALEGRDDPQEVLREVSLLLNQEL